MLETNSENAMVYKNEIKTGPITKKISHTSRLGFAMPIRIFYAQPLGPQIFFTSLPAKLTMGLISYCTVMLGLSFSQCAKRDLNEKSNPIPKS